MGSTRRKLVETTLPLEALNAAGRAEKATPRKGLPATMHPWWSRKPTGIARALLFASVVDDPADGNEDDPEALRQREGLLALVADLAQWNCDETRITEAQAIVAQAVRGGRLKVLDPFCGGGTIPLEAVRLGLDTESGDLNQVAALLTRSLVSLPSAFAGRSPVLGESPASPSVFGGVAADVRAFGEIVLQRLERELAPRYPVVSAEAPPGLQPISYLWARLARCSNPACQAELPLLSTWFIFKKAKAERHVRPVYEGRTVRFEIRDGTPQDLRPPKAGRGDYSCARCGEVTSAREIKLQAQDRPLAQRLVAIQVRSGPGVRAGRRFVGPDGQQEAAAAVANPAAEGLAPLPTTAGNVSAYGIRTMQDLLSPRQWLLMETASACVRALRPEVVEAAQAAGLGDDARAWRDGGSGANAYADVIVTYLAIVLSRMANRVSTMTVHNRANGSVEQSFVQPAFSFYGEFPEANPFSGSTGSFANSLSFVVEAVAALPAASQAVVRQGTADDTLAGQRGVVSTDPPYYDMFDYAALSNLYYFWLRRSLRDVWPLETALVEAASKGQIDSNPGRHGGDRTRAAAVFERELSRALRRVRDAADPRYPTTVYYGYQDTESTRRDGRPSAWEALLTSFVDSALTVERTWPLRTERPEGVKKQRNALASSIVLVCRPRDALADRLTKREFLARLRAVLPAEISTLRVGSIAPVDLAQAAIGPGLAVFTAAREVVESDGTQMTVRTALDHINRAVDECMSENGARDPATRWALAWFEHTGYSSGPFGQAERLANAHNLTIGELAATGMVQASGGRAVLVPRAELGDVGHQPDWVALQRAVHLLETAGERAAGEHVLALPSEGVEAVKDLGYRMFRLAAKRGLAGDAAAYNGLISSWDAVLEAGRQPRLVTA